MPKRTNEFQTLITLIYRQLSGGEAHVIESKMVQDIITGAVREIDVAIEGEYMRQPILLAIECRGRGRKETIEWIDALLGKYHTLPVDKVFAESGSGFTKSAERHALANNIVPLTLESAKSTDWERVARDTKPIDHLLISLMDLRGVILHFSSDPYLLAPSMCRDSGNVIVLDPTDKCIGTVTDIYNNVVQSPFFQRGVGWEVSERTPR